MSKAGIAGTIGVGVLVAIAILAGMQPEVNAMAVAADSVCADVLRSGLKQPSSFELQRSFVNAKEMPLEEALSRIRETIDDEKLEASLIDYAKQDYAAGERVWTVEAVIDYTALNGFGGAVRDEAFCRFEQKAYGGWYLEKFGIDDKMYDGIDFMLEGGFSSGKLTLMNKYEVSFFDRLQALFTTE